MLCSCLTRPVTASRPTETVRLFPIRKPAAMRWTGWLGTACLALSSSRFSPGERTREPPPKTWEAALHRSQPFTVRTCVTRPYKQPCVEWVVPETR